MESIDKDLCELFFSVIKEHFTDFSAIENIKKMKRTLPEIRKKYKGNKLKKETVVRSFPSVKTSGESQMENIAYFYECSSCLASSVAENFSQLMDENAVFFARKMQRKTVNICCMAGGIASEMAATVKILCHKLRDAMPDFISFRLTFINTDDKWNSVILSVLRQIKADVMRNHKMKLTFGFVSAQNNQDVLDALHTTDILISTKFSFEMTNMREKSFKQFLEIALQHMKPDSLLFFIDASTADTINFLVKSISDSKDNCFHIVYKKACDHHCLSLESVEFHLKQYSDYFGVDLNSSYCFFSACAWIKSEARRGSTKANDFPSSTNAPSRTKKDKKQARKDAYWYRRSVDIMYSVASKKI